MQWNEFLFHVRHLTTADQNTIREAFEVGAKAHEHQLRQSGEPYFTHPIAVAQILANMSADRDTIVAALLHDTVEDTPLTLKEIQVSFGPTVANLIDGVTKLSEKELAENPTLNEQIETLRKMFTLMQKDVRIMVVKLADRLHNMQTISFRSAEKQKSVARETMEVYVKIADRLCMRDMRDDLESLCLAILEPDIFGDLADLRKKNEGLGETCIDMMHKKIKEVFPTLAVHMMHEYKTWEKLRVQFELEGDNPTGITGINMTFICEDIDACYRMMGVLHQLWPREALTFEDFINAPVINGYKGLHTTVILDNGTRVRCKIRTLDMQNYAHKGVTLMCFDSRARGLLDYLPWTQHISPVAKDTVQRSELFWQSLQSDILGESMIIYGPANESVLVPRNSTALDGIFYLFGKEALRTKSLSVNGKAAPFHKQLSHASILSPAYADEPLAELRWLQYVHTGTASALIRQQLVKAPESDKEIIGKELLETAVKRQGNIALDEFAPSVVLDHLKRLGFSTLPEVYVHIAEGKLDPKSVAMSFYGQTKNEASEDALWSLSIRFPEGQREQVEHIARMYSFIRLSTKTGKGTGVITAKYKLSGDQSHELQRHLSTVLPREQWMLTRTRLSQGVMLAVITLVILWGLDPVFAHLLLESTLRPFDLTFIRFCTFFTVSTVVFGWQTLFQAQKLKHISPFQPSLILSGIALFITGFFTYMTLSYLPATQYILYIIIGLVLLEFVTKITQKQESEKTGLSLAALFLGISVLMYYQGTSIIGSLSGFVSALGFALYSQVSKRYQEEVVTIHARYPAFIFWVSVTCLLLSIAAYPFSGFNLPSGPDLLRTVMFAFVFAALPYILYFECMRRTESKLLSRSLPLVGLSTIVGEMMITRSLLPLLVVPPLLLFLWMYMGFNLGTKNRALNL